MSDPHERSHRDFSVLYDGLRQAGLSNIAIARELRIGRMTLYRWRRGDCSIPYRDFLRLQMFAQRHGVALNTAARESSINTDTSQALSSKNRQLSVNGLPEKAFLDRPSAKVSG